MFSSKQGFFKTPANGVITVTGGTLSTFGIYSIRTFTSNGTLGISGGNLSFKYLLVGAGSSGTGNTSGNTRGGGAGGQVVEANQFSTSDIPIIIGFNASGNGNTYLGNIVAQRASNISSGQTGATSGSGKTGGAGVGGQTGAGGGGGGQTANGNVATNSVVGGDGGAGYLTNISGTDIYYAAGGGGGGNSYGGLGGSSNAGGIGANATQSAIAPTTYGSGGGGKFSNTYPGTSGANGVVIIRYLTAGTN